MERIRRDHDYLTGIPDKPGPDVGVEIRKQLSDRLRFQNWSLVNLIDKIRLKKGNILIIGSGPGWIPIELARLRCNWNIWGVDASREILDEARCNAEEAGVEDRVHFVPGIMTDLPFETGTFDVVVAQVGLNLMRPPERVFNQMSRVVRGGGKVMIKGILGKSRWRAFYLQMLAKHLFHFNIMPLGIYQEMPFALTIKEIRLALEGSKLSMADLQVFWGLDYIIST